MTFINEKTPNDIEAKVPPISKINEGKSICVERYVIKEGRKYYMRCFSDGSSELVRFDFLARMWTYLCFYRRKLRNEAN